MIKKYEFWHPRVFEFPFYVYLAWLCLKNWISPRTLAKANYALDHGEIGLGSKLASQLVFDQSRFLPSELISEALGVDAKMRQIRDFVDRHGFPVILKSNLGCTGKGLVKLSSAADIETHTPRLLGDFILQDFTPFDFECGVFYIRRQGKPQITGINQKHFPSVVGNGRDTLQTLALTHYRYSPHWDSFLQELDADEVLDEGQVKRLSFIGSHTLGCKFTDDADLLTAELQQAVFALFENQPGFNFGRVDIKAKDKASFQRGEFVVIEVNGVASLPTRMFDPKYSVWQAYKIFFEHARCLVEVAVEHKHKSMPLLPYFEVIRRVKNNQATLNRVHQALMGRAV